MSPVAAPSPPRPTAFAFPAIERLARRVLGGEVVFFVGSGFSIDSERNSADRWIARLLARLLGLGTCLANEAASPASQAREILEGLGRVFGLDDSPRRDGEAIEPARCMTAENVKKLARDYYNFNEWATSALGVLAAETFALPAERFEPVAALAQRLECVLLATLGTDSVPLDEPAWPALRRLERGAERGKALFLDTMGFALPQIMGGETSGPDVDAIAASFGDRLRPRHHALARLAREGFLPILVTTNYDLLLDGAYRLAGFTEVAGDEREALPEDVPPTQIPRFSRVAGRDDFFKRGDGHRAALLLKIHGCVASYRAARRTEVDAPGRSPGARNEWAAYLPSLVFTYREIQTWRADAWSRDLIRTLLRTRTLALCGYSGADPVLHATFREVYDEMAEARRRAASPGRGSAKDAPIFFFAMKGKREFHSFEILRAATEARGDPPGRLVEHPNHVEGDVKGGFPSMDDHFRWLAHRTLRTVQLQALRTRLRRLASRLIGHPCPDDEYREIVRRFRALVAAERSFVRRSADEATARRRFETVVGWTWHFLPGLLRELALAEMIEGRQGPGRLLGSARRWPWYYPASERPEWTAWAAVLELSIRRLVADWRSRRGARAGEHSPFEWLEAEDSPHAAVSFAVDDERPTPVALRIRVTGFERPGRAPRLRGAYRRIVDWPLSEKDVPWGLEPAGLRPAAREVWDWTIASRSHGLDSTEHLGG